MVASRQALLAALAAHGPQAGDVTDVVFSHHHPDHTVNAALFPAARIHDHWAMYVGDRWVLRHRATRPGLTCTVGGSRLSGQVGCYLGRPR